MVHYFKTLLGFAVIGSLHLSGWAQSDWPKAKPVTLVVAFAPGASTDIVARSLTQKLNELTGGNFIVENKGGAGGNIATSQVKRAAPDGYTILVHSVAFAVNPSLYADAGYDALKDFAPVALLIKMPSLLIVPNDLPAKTVPELIALAKSKPGELQYASAGIGSFQHLGGELFGIVFGTVTQMPRLGVVNDRTIIVGDTVNNAEANHRAINRAFDQMDQIIIGQPRADAARVCGGRT